MFLVLIGLLVTIVWLIGGFWYISESGGLEMLAMLLPNEVGDFLTGLFAPLAFVWLIIGYLHFSLRLRRIENGLWDVSAVRIPRADEQPPNRPLEKQGSWLDPPPDDEPPPDKGPPTGGGSAPTDGAPPDKAPSPEQGAKPAKGAKPKRAGSSKTSSRYRAAAWPQGDRSQGDRSSWATPPPSSESRPGRRFAASATRYPPQPRSPGVQSSGPQPAEREDGGPRRGGWFGATSRTMLGRTPNPPQDEQTSQARPEPPPEVPPEAFDQAPPGPSPGSFPGPSPGRSPDVQETPTSGGMASEVFASRMRRQLEGDASPGASERDAGRFGASGVAGFAEMPGAQSVAPPPMSEVARPQTVDAPSPQPVTNVAEPKTLPPILGETVTAAPPAPTPAERPPTPADSTPADTIPAAPTQAADERPFVPPWPGSQVPPAAMAQEVAPAPPPAPGPTAAAPEPPPQVLEPAPTVAAAAPEVAVPEVAVPEVPATEAPIPEPPIPETAVAEKPAPETPAAEAPASSPAVQAPSPAVEAPPPVAEAKPVGFRHLVRITSMELNTISMDLASLLCRESDRAVALKGYDKGEKDVFFGLLTKTLEERDAKEVLQTLLETGADSRLGSYMRKFEALAEESKRVDKSGALAKSLEALPIGRLYQRIRAVKATVSAA